MNPRYLAYCKAHGKTPDEMKAYDYEQWPGGQAVGFILWLGDKWRTFCRMHGTYHTAELELKLGVREAHAAFNAWLKEGTENEVQKQGSPGPEEC